MDNQLPTSGVAAGSRRLGVIVAVLVVLAVAAFGAFYMLWQLGVFYMLRPGAVTDEASLVKEEVVPVEDAVVEEGADAEEVAVAARVVSIKDFKFTPQTKTIKAGESIMWRNYDAAPHTVSAVNGEFNSGNMLTDDRFFPLPLAAGTYQYYCKIHPSMRGTVVVR